MYVGRPDACRSSTTEKLDHSVDHRKRPLVRNAHKQTIENEQSLRWDNKTESVANRRR